MFGKMMNNFYYGKSGKGDYNKDDLPQNRWQLFWEMLKIRLSGLCRLNLMYALVWIPVLLLLFGAVLQLLSGVDSLYRLSDQAIQEIVAIEPAEALISSEAQQAVPAEGALATEGAPITEGALLADGMPDADGILMIDEGQIIEMLRAIIFQTLVLLIPCLAITGPFTAGIAYVTRNWARDEHSFVWSDFKDAVKANWKQGLVVSAITSVMPLILYMCWMYYGEMAADSVFFIIPQVLSVMFVVIWLCSLLYQYPLMVTYKLRLRDVFRNSLFLTIGRLPMTVGLKLLSLAPIAISVLVCFFTAYYEITIMVLALYYILFGFSLSRFIGASYSNAVFDRFINPNIEGAEVDRGLYREEDEEEGLEIPQYSAGKHAELPLLQPGKILQSP